MEEYGIPAKQIMSLTTDNAGNMRTLLKNMNERLLHENDDEPMINLGGNSNVLVYFILVEIISIFIESLAIQNLRIDVDNASVLNLMIIEYKNQAKFDDEIAEILHDYNIGDDDDWELRDLSHFDLPNNIEQTENVRPFFIDGINCAAHTLQLAVKNALSRQVQ